MICKDAEVLKQAKWLRTLADATGEVHLSVARFSMTSAEMAQAALKRENLYAEEGAWEAWSRAFFETSSWEAEEDSVNGTVNIEQPSSMLMSNNVLSKQSIEVSATSFVEGSRRCSTHVQISRSVAR